MPDPVTMEVIAAELRGLVQDIAEIKHAMKNVQSSQALYFERLIITEQVQKHQNEAVKRAFESLAEIDRRVTELEVQQPMTKLVRNWGLGFVVAGFLMAGAQVWSTNKVSDRPVVVVDRDSVGRLRADKIEAPNARESR